MARAPALPFLPGLTFNPNIGRTNFRIDPKFDFNEGIPCLVEKVKPNLFGPLTDKYPSLYARGEVIELPPWIAFDKQILCFDAFFKQTLQEVLNAAYIVRKVKIYFFLEDGTIQIMEKKEENSGMEQGCLLARQRIRMPPPMDENFYDILNFNVGREIEIFGKFFKVTNCDKFTRNFLNRNGITVPDPINIPVDPYLTNRAKQASMCHPKKPNKTIDNFGKFLKYDRKILRFYAYWDDRDKEHGELHDLEVYYYLADDTMEVKDILPDGGKDSTSLLMKRGKLPKVFKELPHPGLEEPVSVLNVLGAGVKGGRYIKDPLECGREKVDYYKDNDLSIGGIVNCFGRKVVLIDADINTREYYRTNYGVSNFVPIPKPVLPSICHKFDKKDRELPPWNGYGTYEDSAQNCVTVELKPPLKDFKKFLAYDRKGMDSHILRYEARMISKIGLNCDRKFVISYFLSDDTIQVVEVGRSGEGRSMFFARQEIIMPGQDLFQSKKPLTYKPQHFFIGAQIVINSFQFILINSDDYALRYMETHPSDFPKSDIKVIMEKLREKLRPIYKDFVDKMIPTENISISYDILRNKLCPIMGDDFTEHEMITISRAFSLDCMELRLNRNAIRAITLTELKRFLWDDLDRFQEYVLLRDPTRTGKLSRKDVYTVLRGCRLPLDVQLVEKIIDVVNKDENGLICYDDLINFLDRKNCPLTDTIPLNIKSELWWASEKEAEKGRNIDWCEFNKALDLEHIFKEKPIPQSIYAVQK